MCLTDISWLLASLLTSVILPGLIPFLWSWNLTWILFLNEAVGEKYLCHSKELWLGLYIWYNNDEIFRCVDFCMLAPKEGLFKETFLKRNIFRKLMCFLQLQNENLKMLFKESKSRQCIFLETTTQFYTYTEFYIFFFIIFHLST